MSIEVNDESGFQPAIELSEISELAAFVLGELKVHPRAELAVVLVDEDTSSDLHVKWMDLDGPADVLSFPMDELRPGTVEVATEGVLGDIVICPSVAARQAAAAGHATEDEILLLTTHGILHLLGFDHQEEAEREEMFALQRQLLLTFLASRDPERAVNPPEPTVE
ncbi:MAG: rRNA maturation RNase YbeY [Actinomycetaceae bacterium]|nr:rRNA maturation RNase YbeY [Actinomycetaceae bacterium]